MLFVDGMNGLIYHNETVQWLYTLAGSKVNNMNMNFQQILSHPLRCSRYIIESSRQHHLCSDGSENMHSDVPLQAALMLLWSTQPSSGQIVQQVCCNRNSHVLPQSVYTGVPAYCFSAFV